MLEVSADICNLFNADRLTIYTIGEDKQTIVSKVKTGLNSFKDLKLPIAEHSIAGYVALSKKMLNLKDVYDDAELKQYNPNLRFLQEVDKRTGYRTKQMLVAPVVEAGSNELIGVVQLINNKTGVPFGPLAEEGVQELCQTLAIAFSQRQKPQVVKTKYDFLVSDAVISVAEFELAARSARKKAVDIEAVLVDEFQVKLPAIGQALSKFFGVPYEPFKADRIKPMDLLKNLKREYVDSNQWLPIEDSKEGLIVICPDPERVKSSRIVNNVFPKHRLVFRVTTQKEFHETVNQFYGVETVDTSGDIGDMLSVMGEDEEETSPGRRRRRFRGGRQRAGEAGQQDHHRRLQSGCLGHPRRVLPGQGQDGDPLPQGRIARALHRGARFLPQCHHRAAQDHVRPGYFGAQKAAGRQDQVQEVRAAGHRAAGGDDSGAGGRRGLRDAYPRRRRTDSAG